ncbi:MAG: molecular chaperone TorD family protein [Acidimicrobiales bacterium]
MSAGGVVQNGARGELAPKAQNGDWKASATGSPGREVVGAAADLLSHFWSRPLPEEVDSWVEAQELLSETHRLVSSEPATEPVELPAGADEAPALLDEFERLFVGPGQVPCPPYESFWREDVPVDIRRTLMGPCTAELKELYRELGLQVSAGSGELPDHIAIELEALAYSLSSEATDAVAERLFAEHLAKFLPRLCRAVTHDSESPFYRGLAALTLDWLVGVRAYFAIAEMG